MCLAAQSCPTLCDPRDRSPPGSSVHGDSPGRTLKWVAMPSSRGSSQPRDWTRVSRVAGGFLTVWASREARPPYRFPLHGCSVASGGSLSAGSADEAERPSNSFQLVKLGREKSNGQDNGVTARLLTFQFIWDSVWFYWRRQRRKRFRSSLPTSNRIDELEGEVFPTLAGFCLSPCSVRPSVRCGWGFIPCGREKWGWSVLHRGWKGFLEVNQTSIF